MKQAWKIWQKPVFVPVLYSRKYMWMLDNYLWILDNRRELEKERDTRREIMRIGIGNDHSALELKAEIIEFLKEKGHEVVDFGTVHLKAVTIRSMGKQ